MTTDPRVIAVMRASFDYWRTNADRLGVHMERARTIEDMPEDERRFAEGHARACILKWLEQEPSDKMLLIGCDNTLSHPSFLRGTFKMMNAQAAKEIAE